MICFAQRISEFATRAPKGFLQEGINHEAVGLAGHLGSPGVVTPAEAEAWAMSDEGRAFMTLSAERWRDAHIAAGADPAAAADSAARTAAFYTGTAVDDAEAPAAAE